MAYLNQICNYINNVVVEKTFSGHSFDDKKIFPICEQWPSPIKGKNIIAYRNPENGELTEIDVDDSLSLTIYHRILSIQTTQNDSGFGDKKYTQSTANMKMVLIYDSKIMNLNKSIDYIITLMSSSFPQTISLDMKNMFKFVSNKITTGEINPNTIGLIKEEYTGIDLINPMINIASVNYTITSIFDPTCIEKCEC